MSAVGLIVAGGDQLIGVGILLAIVFGLSFLVAFVNDLRIPAVRGRESARDAALCFVRSLRIGSWRRAYACVQPSTLPEREMLPVIERLRIVPAQVSRRTRGGFTQYWKAVLCRRDGIIRTARGAKLSKLETRAGQCVRVTATLRVEVYSATIYLWLLVGMLPLIVAYLVTRKKAQVHLELLLYRHRSQWWVLASQPTDAEGRPELPAARVV